MTLAKLRILFTRIFCIVLAVHIIQTAVIMYADYRQSQTPPSDWLLEPGYTYENLLPWLNGETAVGYLTDLDLSPESADTENFLSAQYKLAPVRLEVNNKNLKLILIDASSLSTAFTIMEKIPATPVHWNRYGKLIVQRP